MASKPCSVCGRVLAVNARSRPEPVCQSCRAERRVSRPVPDRSALARDAALIRWSVPRPAPAPHKPPVREIRYRSKLAPCAGGCGELVWKSRTSLPPGQSTCRTCRAQRLRRGPRCRWCGDRCTGQAQRFCSRICSNQAVNAARSARVVLPIRQCEVCGQPFKAGGGGRSRKQLSCSRACGVVLRGQTPGGAKQWPSTRVWIPHCRTCSRLFVARSARTRDCSYACRVRRSADRLNDLYALACSRGAGGARWRDLLVGYMRERDGDRCAICRKAIRFDLPSGPLGHKSGLGPSVDHVVPRSQGGSDDLANLRLAHWACNRKRRAKGGNEQLALIG